MGQTGPLFGGTVPVGLSELADRFHRVTSLLGFAMIVAKSCLNAG
jgi:hypothetical protein